MSKDNPNLRLSGSPVNLSYRGRKKEDKNNIRNRPRSALQNSCFTPDCHERFRRPFSADTKERAPSTRSFLKTLSAELLQTYSLTPKVGPPSADLLAKSKSVEGRCYYLDKDICSNASDYGSEDTFISLGTKIKAKAQSGSKQKQLKYKNAGKRGRKNMEHLDNDKTGNDYGLQIKITERPQRVSSPNKLEGANGENSILKNRNYESYFIPLESGKKFDENSLAGRVSFGSNVNNEVEQAIDKYSRRLSLTKQQLSLVEEESTQDLESMQSHSNNMSSLSPENSLEDPKNVNAAVPVKDRAKREDEFSKTFKNCDPKTYNSFYDDFRIEEIDDYKRAMSSTVIHADASSKDSGYPDSGNNEEKSYKQNICVPKSPFIKKSKSQSKVGQPKSFDGISRLDTRGTWSEPLNHSRLLYKDFFLKKEGHISIAPQNSLTNISDPNIPGTSEVKNDPKIENIDENLMYPPYLLNSSTKAYTSKVIEDYKKELEAINNLHELTLKDIKIDAISPTPLNIDKMFEDHLKPEDIVTSDNSQDSPEKKAIPKKNTLDTSTKDVSKISTKELIQNYWKVKGSDYKDFTPKTAKRFEKKCSNLSSKIDEIIGVGGLKHEWNNRTSSSNIPKTVIPVNIRNQTQKNMFTMKAPLSARIESVQNDRDVDSWMSLTAPSPRLIEAENESLVENSKPDENPSPSGVSEEININPNDNMKTDKDIPKPKDLSSNSTVLDIYSMLKEIESYGDNPVTSVATHDTLEKGSNDVIKEVSSQSPPPKDNFLEIFEFLEKVEQSANDALSVVTTTVPQTTPKLESLLKLPQTELAQRLVTASLQLEERSCCIALLQESLANHKEQMVQKVSNLEKQSLRQIGKVKQECEQTIKRHQNFIDQLINDKKTLNHRIEQLVDERRSLEERWKRSAASLEERYKLELRNQHDKMAAAQQVARQRWVRQKAEKIKELTVKGLEGELREMAERQQKEISDLKMYHAEQTGRIQAKHSQEIEELRRSLEAEKEAALVKERQMASSRLEKQILELELTYQEQRTRLVAEMRAENERAAQGLSEKEREHKLEIDNWKEEQERLLEERRQKMENEMAEKRSKMEEEIKLNRLELEKKFEQFKQDYDAEQQVLLRKKVTEISAQHKQERDRDIEKAIESLEAEAHSGRKELQEALRRNKEQYETELRELAATEQATLRRYQDAQARIRLTEDRCAELEITITQLETRNRVLIEKNNQLDTRAEEIKKSCEESWQKKVETLQKEMEDMKKTHDEQMHQLYAKVKVAVARKDSAIQALTRENGKYQEKVTLLEQKLQQQRKDFLKQK